VDPPITSLAVNQMKTRLQSLGLLDRAIRETTDEELETVVAALGDDHREAIERFTDGDATPESVRAAAVKGRLDGTMEGLALVLTDAALADCIKELGDHADNPTSDQLRKVLPGLVERHGLGVTRMMLASTVVGEAAAANVVRDLLKHDELVALPKGEPAPSPIVRAPEVSDVERDAIKAKRQELKRKKQAEARQRREQSARARNRI
jgi:hypothetical protein